MRYAKLGALGVFAAALCGGSAMAQQLYQPFVANESSPTGPQSRIARSSQPNGQRIDFYASETYDSNVAQSDAALAASRGLKLSDEITQVGFDAEVIQNLGLQRFFIRGNFSYNWYARNRILDTASADFAGGDTLRLGDCQATVQGDYYRGRRDTALLPNVNIENVRSTGSINGNIACGRQYGLAPSVSVTERWNTNSAFDFRNANSRIFTAAGGLDFRTPGLGTLGLFGEYDNVRYTDSIIFVGGQFFRTEFETFTGGLKYSKQLTPNFGAQAYLTYTNVTSNISENSRFNGLTYSLALNYAVAPRLSADLYFSREVLPSDLPNETYTVVENYHGTINYAVGSRLHLQLEGSADHYNYRGTTALLPPNPFFDLRDQTVYRVKASALFALNDHVRFELDAGEERRDTSFAELNYWATILAVKVRADFGR